jgi:hypothetical protein
MNDALAKHFGYLIAYVLPGFVVLWGLRPLSPTIHEWMATSPAFPAGIESIVFVGLASVAAGMTVSALRWLVIDTLLAWTGVRRPTWNYATLGDRLAAFEALVDAHFRYYQFYANTAVAAGLAFAVALATHSLPAGNLAVWWGVFLAVESLFLVTSRDNLRNYYRRASRLLGERR